MKKIYNFVLIACCAAAFVSCDDLLDTENYTKQDSSNFPSTITDVNNELAAMYGAMNDMNNYPLEMPYFIDDIMSDDNLGGGSDADKEPKALEHFTSVGGGMFDHFWELAYAGIARANGIIYTIDNVDWKGDVDARNQACGEGYFMRALYHFWLTQHFGDIPLINTASVPNPCPEVSAENEVYPQIMSDLYSASKLMNKKIDGHANKYAAEALLARVYMFYHGFYKNAGELAKANLEPVELNAQDSVKAGTVLTKENVIDALKDIKKNGGFSLLKDFRSLWQYSNRVTQKDYPYTQDIPADQTFKNGNDEELFQIRFGNATTYAGDPATKYPLAYTNYISLYLALRCDGDNGKEGTFPYGEGWGQCTVSSALVNDWEAAETVDKKEDPRRKASIIDCANDLTSYQYTSKCTEETGYYTRKYMSVTAKSDIAGTKTQDWNKTTDYTWWAFEAAWTGMSGANNMQEGHYADYYLIRYADVLLMLTELTGDKQYMNEVRDRAKLPPHEYTWTNIQNERRFELAFEGQRYQDLRRWSGINATESSLICTALGKEEGQDINCQGSWRTLRHMSGADNGWAKRYVATKGFLRKPDAQIQLANGAMKQNEGWTGADAQYSVIY